MKTKFYKCEHRGFGVTSASYCDWFEVKRKSLTKRCCRNCKHLTEEQVTDGQCIKKENISGETESEENSEPKKED